MPGRDIIGESFKDYVINQIDTRQKKLAINGNYTPDLLQYMNSKTSWIRLSSGVDVSREKAAELNVSALAGEKLAQKYALFSARFDGAFTQGVGFDPNNTTSYGFLSNSTYGYVPPPGIISADVKPLNNGTLREVTVQITCHNLEQFKIIEALYLRLKYSMLLEWGHTLWYDNNGILHADIPGYTQSKFLDGSYANQDEVFVDLEANREYSCGNYDGYLGLVKNFTWVIRKDGGYDITLNLTSIGDVIESLKINTNYPGIKATDTTATTSTEPQPPVIANKNKSTIHQILFAIKTELDIQGQNGYLNGPNLTGESSLSAEEIVRITKAHSQYDLIEPNYKDPNEIYNKANNILTTYEAIRKQFPGLNAKEDNTSGYFYYIKLGTLLRIIESFLLKYDTAKGTAGNYRPLFYLDHDYDTNLCLALSRQISTDPKICFLSPDNLKTYNKSEDFRTFGSTSATTQFLKYEFVVVEEEKFGFNNYYFQPISNGEVVSGDQVTNTATILELNTTSQEQTDISGSKVSRITEFNTTLKTLTGAVQNFRVAGSDESTTGKRWGPYFKEVDVVNTITPSAKTNTEGESSTNQNSNNFKDSGTDHYRINPSPFLGRFMHIQVNLDFISSTLSGNIDNEGKVALYPFLDAIMKGIQNSIGQINDFRITYDEVTNCFVIRDKSNLPGADKYLGRKSTAVQFNTHILTQNKGSFVTDVSVKSELNNNFATMITVGAQVNSNKVGENATALSRFNYGYEDRIVTDKSSIMDDNNASDSGSLTPEEAYKGNLVKYSQYINNLNNGSLSSEDISNNSQAVVDMLNYEVGYLTQNQNVHGKGFIPLSLQLTMDGLSGPRLFETYTIDDTFLPPNYKNAIKFITKGITHRIDSNGWVTSLESFSVPNLDVLAKYTAPPEPKVSEQPKSETPPQTSGDQVPTSQDKCGKANGNTVNAVYPRSVKWQRGIDSVKVPIEKSPGYVVKLANQPVVGYVKTLKSYQEVIKIVETVVDQLAPNASSNNKKLIIASALAISISEQSGGEGKIKGFNNNLTGTESDGFKVFNASDINGKVSLEEGGTGKRKYYYSFSSPEAGYVPLISKILERNMFAISGDPNEFAWRWFRDWNGYGARTKKDYIAGKINDCSIIAGKESNYNKALKAVNVYSKYK
jgi:hypothetical protein